MQTVAEIMRDWASLNLLGALLWAMWVECRRLRQEARGR